MSGSHGGVSRCARKGNGITHVFHARYVVQQALDDRRARPRDDLMTALTEASIVDEHGEIIELER